MFGKMKLLQKLNQRKRRFSPYLVYTRRKNYLIIKIKKCASKTPVTIVVNDEMLKTKSVDFLNELCKYFANVGANMNETLNSNDLKLTIRAKCCSQSFKFLEITVKEINSCINKFKNRSAPTLDGNKLKFIKMSKVYLAPFLATFF